MEKKNFKENMFSSLYFQNIIRLKIKKIRIKNYNKVNQELLTVCNNNTTNNYLVY